MIFFKILRGRDIMEEINKEKLSMKEFEKKPDGTWVCVRNKDIQTKSGRVIRVLPGTVFKKGFPLWGGCYVAETLDEVSSN